MTTLQKIVKEAKRLKKLHPKKFAKWTDYVKAASKTIKKTGSKKVADVNVTYRSQKDADYIVERKRDGKFKGMLRVAGTRTKKKPATHTDKGSHNVKIKVVSGADDRQFYTTQLNYILMRIRHNDHVIEQNKLLLKSAKTVAEKSFYKKVIAARKEMNILLKKQLVLVKKSIK